jgi:hypothetical protein
MRYRSLDATGMQVSLCLGRAATPRPRTAS